MICAGIDAGSRSIKAVLFDTDRPQILASGLADQGVEQERLAAELFEKLLQRGGPGPVAHFRRRGHRLRTQRHPFRRHHHHRNHLPRARRPPLAPDARTIIEIGGQDSKVISLEDGGRVRDFAMNDRCAAGTGRFLEMVAARLDMNWEKLAELGRQSKKPALISNMCVVFAETEIIGLLAEGKPLPDVVAGVQNAIATRVAALAGPLRFAAGLFHRRRRVAARHGPRAGGSFGLSGPRRAAARNSPAPSAPRFWRGSGRCKCGVRSAEWGVRGGRRAEGGVGSAEWGVRSAECGVRSGECGVGSAEWGVRSAEWGVRSGECGVRSDGGDEAKAEG